MLVWMESGQAFTASALSIPICDGGAKQTSKQTNKQTDKKKQGAMFK
jgi:hypothetical protein